MLSLLDQHHTLWTDGRLGEQTNLDPKLLILLDIIYSFQLCTKEYVAERGQSHEQLVMFHKRNERASKWEEEKEKERAREGKREREREKEKARARKKKNRTIELKKNDLFNFGWSWTCTTIKWWNILRLHRICESVINFINGSWPECELSKASPFWNSK